jgi:hypothetical protein
MPPGSKKSPPALTDVQRLFGEDRLPDEVDVERDGAASAAEETAEMRAALDRHRTGDMRETARARMLAEAPPEVLAELAKAEGVTPSWLKAVACGTDRAPSGSGWRCTRERGHQGPCAAVLDGDPRNHFTPDLPTELREWFLPLVRPPRDDLVGAYACLLVASIIGAEREDGLVTNDDLFALLPRATVNDALQRLRYSGLLKIQDDGRFRVVKTPLDMLKEKAS